MVKDLYNVSGPKAWIIVKSIASVLKDLTDKDFRNILQIIIDKFKDKAAVEIIEDILDSVIRFHKTGTEVLNEIKGKQLLEKTAKLHKKHKFQEARIKRSKRRA